ncbi:MAG TPA: hypothetical protein VEL11_02175 [Candidatus Bathyarchaeia archaeon]|nr:hypothetical protein [Candidatus Bathyarchaeia archaeon]
MVKLTTSLLTGDPFVDNCLAVIAVSAKCKTLEGLTLAKMKRIHYRNKGMALARTNDRLSATSMVFPNSKLTNQNTKFRQDPKRVANYAKLTTVFLENIGHESIKQRCDICGNDKSADLDLLVKKVFPPDPKKDDRYYIGREWFPLTGSMNDAQALPAAIRSLNCCAKCLYAIQYLPQSVFFMKNHLVVLSCTSTKLWYGFVKQIVESVHRRVVGTGKVATIGTEKSGEWGYSVVIEQLMKVMKTSKHESLGSVSMWMFKNIGTDADLDKQMIPNPALEFIYQISRYVSRREVIELTIRDKNYGESMLNCIINKRDYLRLYPSKKFKSKGASHELFTLYQRLVMGEQRDLLKTAFNIAKYIDNNLHDEKFGIDLDDRSNLRKQMKARQLIVEMVQKRLLNFNEYYHLFIGIDDNGHPWRLLTF